MSGSRVRLGLRGLTRDRSAPEAVLERFTSRLGPPLAPEELLLQLVEALKASLRASRAEAWIVDGGRVTRTVSVPHRGEGDSFDIATREHRQLSRPHVYGRAWAQLWVPSLLGGRDDCSLRIAPVVNEGEPLAILVVERSARDDFTTAEERALSELARHLGLSLHNERLRIVLEATLADVRRANDELQASRARIVETADAERRRIERDLHDGAQQQLIALSIDLQLARDALHTDVAVAAARLDHASTAAADAIDELTDLAHGIYPPVLRDAGLDAAVRMAARRHPSSVSVHAARLERHPPAVEAAIYFAIVEALQNAAKHAAGAPVTITVAEDGARIEFDVADEGPGFALGAAPSGQGMLNIGDRIGAIGGCVAWESSPGAGTRVRGSVPVAQEAA
jgi:signal transduction histidine kinase